MDILAASYTNIGPFYDRTVSVVFHKGKYVVSAPVGSGKSFLFFDGPIFSLYKYAARPIRNRRSATGQTQLLFSRFDDIWLIVRNIGSTKTGGDSVKSKLYSYTGPKGFISKELLGYETFGANSWLQLWGDYFEEVSCANEKEVDVLMQDLLPPREVVLSANFLMQDAINIFEIPPAKRLEVFKHIFGFVGIDHAKDRIRDARKEAQTRIMVAKDTSDTEKTFAAITSSMRDTLQFLSALSLDDEIFQQHKQQILHIPFFHDMLVLDAQMQLGTVYSIDRTILTETKAHIDQKILTYTTLQGKKQQLEETVRTHEQGFSRLEHEMKDLTSKIKTYEQEHTKKDRSILEKLEQERSEGEKKKALYLPELYINILQKAGYKVESFEDCVREIEKIIVLGKEAKRTVEHFHDQMNLISKQQMDIDKRKKELVDNKSLLQRQYDDQVLFECDKIQGPCPYVQVIKGAGMKALRQQQERVEKQLKDIEVNIQTYTQKKEKLMNDIKDAENNSKEYRDLLHDIQRKKCLDEYAAWQIITKQLIDIDKRIQVHTKDLLQDQEKQQTYASRKTKLLVLQEEYQRQKTLHASVVQKMQDVSSVTADDKVTLESIKGHLDGLLQLDKQMDVCMQEQSKRQRLVQELEEKQLRLKHLYTLFSKELLLVVLQDFLPNIESMMNTYLDDVADYTVLFSLEDDESDTISLDIFAQDHRGGRPVKSLSGGQKSLLKLAWILSIASLMKLPFLFLDETITSLDASTTGDVADVLHRFVQTHDITFYVVTHATQIQDIPIWDKELHIPID